MNCPLVIKHVVPLLTAVIITFGFGSPGTLSATTVIAVNLAKMSETAESAFVVRIDAVESTTTVEGSYDVVSGIVVDSVFGDVQTSEPVSWKQFRVSRAATLAGMPTYEIGKEYLIFLSGKGRGTEFQMPVGMGQGAFKAIRTPSGDMMVRNAFMNSTLSAGLDTTAAAKAIINDSPRTRGLTRGARESEARRLQEQLRPKPVGNSFRDIKEAARFFHDEKKRGKTPSKDFFTTAPMRLLQSGLSR